MIDVALQWVSWGGGLRGQKGGQAHSPLGVGWPKLLPDEWTCD